MDNWQSYYWAEERKRLCFRIHKLKYDLNRVEGLLELREKKFTAEHQKNYGTISTLQSEISSLKQSLQLQIEQVVTIKDQQIQEMEASLEAERQKAAEQSTELFVLKLKNRKNDLLQNQLQMKVEQLEEQLNQKDKELLELKTKKDLPSCRLLGTTNNLGSNSAVFNKNYDVGQVKYSSLQEQFSKELAEKQKNWETTVRELRKEKEEEEIKKEEQEEKDSVRPRVMELTDQLKTTTAEFQESDNKNNALQDQFSEELVQTEEERTVKQVKKDKKDLKEEQKKKEREAKEERKRKETEEKEMKMKQKEERKEMEKKEKEEKKEMKKKEKEEKKEMEKKEKEAKAEMKKKEKQEKKKRKQEKESTGFFSWLRRKRTCKGDTKVEDAAGCSAQPSEQ